MTDAPKILGLAVAAGLLAGAVSGAGVAVALQGTSEPPPPAVGPAPTSVSVDKLVAADRLKLVENAGARLVIGEGRKAAASFLHAEGGGGVLNLYAEDGGLRVQVGSYSRGAEKGQPLIGLSDNTAKLRLLLRLAGKNESPVLVFKDTAGRDRMVMGLGMNDAAQEPFIATFDQNGKKTLLTGSY